MEEIWKDIENWDGFPCGSQKSNSKLNVEAVAHIRLKVMRNIDYCKLYGVAPSTITCIQKDKHRWANASV